MAGYDREEYRRAFIKSPIRVSSDLASRFLTEMPVDIPHGRNPPSPSSADHQQLTRPRGSAASCCWSTQFVNDLCLRTRAPLGL